MDKKTTHYDRVLQYLQDFGEITSWDAIREFGNTRLSATIYLLRKDGWQIKTEFKADKNRYGDPVSYAVYKLEQGD